MSDLIRVEEVQDHVGLLTLHRPEAANALSHELLDALRDSLVQLKTKEPYRALIITGAGEKAFCAGADLKERKGMTEAQVIQTVEKIGRTIRLIEEFPAPTIAAVNGAAFGGGLELALGCDLRIMSTKAKAGLTETSLAIIPGAGGTQRLTRLIGLGKAKEMIFTAKPVDADRAFALGLVEHLSEPDNLLSEAKQLAGMIAENGPVALKEAKKAIQLGFQTDLTTGMEIERLCYQNTIPTEDRLEGLQAFKEKRKPIYKGK
ncbi:enoyl-CoA hydratase-related protein [Halobacillus salinarum]|uniref:Enoyl-CoA hydratase-related protein n=1 Tax=Halobacillus salinarum TaxID=2932257 RepID=A0ABY4EG16_9BACI|nr:enoyl-CoA hydratase-related protein [Halobacillus salinarum]UOQ42935.1 enoyl-CoA hydratase-related protein [Halobacillus salinarum]